jgi:phage terminase large subunit GpA-like protein
MVSTFLEAKKYPETLKVFTNTALAESWEEQGHTVEGDPLLRRRELYSHDAPEGYCHFPIHYDEGYFAMLTAEHCVTRFHKGVARREWVLKKGQKRNEALDIFVYNFVALKILNPNFEVLEKNMAGIEVKPLKKVNKPYKIRREGSFVSGFK